MAETKKKNKKKKVTISEEDMYLILQRYSVTTIIAMMQEVAQYPDAKIDWNELVKNTKTGINNAREYQMLWRHLAYRDTLFDNVDNEAEPLDDDSDLESDLEAFPPVSGEASAEAAACAKVLLGHGLPSDSNSLNVIVEAPLTINIPDGRAACGDSEIPPSVLTQGKNIIVPVSIQRQSAPTVTCAEGLEGSGSPAGGLQPRRKRKPWTEEEDMELIAAVQKCGERNWANILKGDFKGDRTASQLSQRWAIIRKRQANLNSGGAGNISNSQLTEAQLATRRAVSHALNMPMVDNFSAACSAGATTSSVPSSSAAGASTAGASMAGASAAVASTAVASAAGTSTAVASTAVVSAAVASTAVASAPEDTSPISQTQQAPLQKGALNPTLKSRVTVLTAKKGPSVPFKHISGPNMIQAAAVAAGARIATPSTAASLLKAAKSGNVVHIRPGGSSMMKTPISGVAKSSPTSHLGSHPNVHYIRTGLVSTSAAPTYSVRSPSIPPPGSSQQEHGNSTRPQMVTCSLPPISTSSALLSQQLMAASSPSVTLGGSIDNKVANAISTVDRFLSQEDDKSKVMKEDGPRNVSEEFGNGKAKVLKLEASTDNQTTIVEDLTKPHTVDAGEIKPVLDIVKQSESSHALKTEVCTEKMDED